MFQSQDYHRESDNNNSRQYVNDSNSGRDNRDNYHYKTSYNQGRDGGYQAGNRDYSRDGGNVEYSKTTKYSEERSPSYGPSSYATGGYSGTATVNRSNGNDSQYYSRSDRYGDSSARNNQVQYSSSSFPSQSYPSQSQSTSYNRDNDRSRDQDNKGTNTYWQQTKTYHNDQPTGYGSAYDRSYNVDSSRNMGGSYGIVDSDRNRNLNVYDSSRSYGSNDSDRNRSYNTDTSSRGYGGGDSGYRGQVSYSSSTGTGAGASAGGSAYSSSNYRN